MSSICGIFSRSGLPVPPGLIEAMTATLGHWQRDGDRTGTWCSASGTVTLGHVMLANTPESLDEMLPFHYPGGRLTITADARIDNREDLCRRLDIPPQEQTTLPDSQLILNAYLRWGRDCVTRLIGDFAFAIWDEGEKMLFCARDRMGIKPLFYFFSNDYFIFATGMKGIFKVTGEPRDLNQEWVADALTALVANKEYTPYPGVTRLLPAHWLSISPGKIKKQCYWNLKPGLELHLSSEDDYVEAFGEKLKEAVRCRVRSVFPVGSELSGGLDSSAVTALAARQAAVQGLEIIAFSHVLGEGDQTLGGMIKDEKKFADLLRRHAGIRRSCQLTSRGRGIIEALKHSLQVQDGPTMQNFYVYSDVLYEAGAKEGICTLLSGFGGDEMVSIEAGGYLDELVQTKAWRNLWHEYRQSKVRGKKISLKTLLFKMAGEYFPLLETTAGHIRDKRRGIEENSPSFHLETYSLAPGFYQEAGIRQRLAEIPRHPRGGSVGSLQDRLVMHPHVPLRMEYSSIAAAAHRIEYRYPLLDTRLLEFHLAVPANLKRKNGCGRYLFRRAIEGIVPPGIQWRQDKAGSAIPGSLQRFTRDTREIGDLVDRARHTRGAYYLDSDRMLKRRDRILKMETIPVPMRRGAYLNALMLLLYFEDQK